MLIVCYMEGILSEVTATLQAKAAVLATKRGAIFMNARKKYNFDVDMRMLELRHKTESIMLNWKSLDDTW